MGLLKRKENVHNGVVEDKGNNMNPIEDRPSVPPRLPQKPVVLRVHRLRR
jgi:hypothetical protein